MQKDVRALQCYLVLDAAVCGNESSMLRIAQASIEAGIGTIQLRMKREDKKRYIAMASQLKALLSDTNIPLIINDAVDVAIAVDAEGVHVGQFDMPAKMARTLIGPDKWLGLSVTDATSLAFLPTQEVDYLGVGPIFATSSKKNAASPMGLVTLKHITAYVAPLPVVAIGGIELTHIKALRRTGVCGVAVIAAICRHTNPKEATRLLVEAWRKNHDF